MTNPKFLKIEHLITVEPITDNQAIAYRAWKKSGDHLVLSGCAGTGKTFTAMYLALEQVLDKGTPWERLIIVRSVVPSRDIGFLPGTEEEKLQSYTIPYKDICRELLPQGNEPYDQLVSQGIIEFHSTSFLRGSTFDNAIILVDEMQNMTGRELNTIITRVGQDTRIIFAGDYYQSDFVKGKDKNDILAFLEILKELRNFTTVEFGWSDIVRSDFVRDYILTKSMKEQNGDINVDW